MKIFIEEVSISNIDDSVIPPQILEYKILGKLESGQEIKIVDDDLFDLRDFKNKWVNCLIYVGKGAINIKETIEGEFVKDINVPKIELDKYICNYSDLNSTIEEFKGIQTDDGIFIISPEASFRNGQKVKYRVGQFSLMAWYPIEE